MIENLSDIQETKADEPVKKMWLMDAVRDEKLKINVPEDYYEYQRGFGSRFGSGVIQAVESIKDIPEQVEIFGDRTSYGFGGYFGDTPQDTDRKKLNLMTAERELLATQKERMQYLSSKETDTLAYDLGGGTVSYGTMLAGGYVGGLLKAGVATGVATMATLELGEQVSERTPIKDGMLDVEKMTPEWARKATGGTVAYLATSAVLEKYAGYGLETKLWEKPFKLSNKKFADILTAGKKGIKTAVAEGVFHFSSLLNKSQHARSSNDMS